MWETRRRCLRPYVVRFRSICVHFTVKNSTFFWRRYGQKFRSGLQNTLFQVKISKYFGVEGGGVPRPHTALSLPNESFCISLTYPRIPASFTPIRHCCKAVVAGRLGSHNWIGKKIGLPCLLPVTGDISLMSISGRACWCCCCCCWWCWRWWRCSKYTATTPV